MDVGGLFFAPCAAEQVDQGQRRTGRIASGPFFGLKVPLVGERMQRSRSERDSGRITGIRLGHCSVSPGHPADQPVAPELVTLDTRDGVGGTWCGLQICAHSGATRYSQDANNDGVVRPLFQEVDG